MKPDQTNFMNDKTEDDSCQRTQPYNHFVSFFTDKEEEIVLNEKFRQDVP